MALTKVTGSVIKDSVSLSGNVSVGGTLTYQDVTNVDALGVGTFRTGIKVLAGQVDVGSNIKLGNAGVITATSFSGVMSGTTGSFSGQVNVGSNIKLGTAGVVTATSFVGSGAQLTSIPITSGADNRIITASGANTIQGESSLTFDGTSFVNTGGIILAQRGSIPSIESKNTTTSSYARVYLSQTSGSGGYAAFQKLGTTSTAIGGANATQVWCTGDAPLVIGVNNGERLRITSGGNVQVNGGALHLDANGELAVFETDTNLAFTNSAKLAFDYSGNVARIRSSHNGSGTTRPLAFYIANDEILRINTNGKVSLGSAPPTSPVAWLHVKGNTYQTLRLENYDGGGNGPYIELYNNSASPADDDYTGIISFKNRNSANEEITYSQILSLIHI